jgi:hypothetical protein
MVGIPMQAWSRILFPPGNVSSSKKKPLLFRQHTLEVVGQAPRQKTAEQIADFWTLHKSP